MKNLLTTLGAFIFLLIPIQALADYQGSTFADSRLNQCYTLDTGETLGDGSTVWWNPTHDYYLVKSGLDPYIRSSDLSTFVDPYFGPPPNAEYYVNSPTPDAGGATWFVNTGASPAGTFSVVGPCAPPPPTPTGGTLADQIAAAQSGMASTTGFNIGAVITWSGDNLLKVFIGSGVAVLFELRYWLVAMVIISLIVLFAFRGMRFFKH